MSDAFGELGRAAFLPVSLLWGVISKSRNILYDRGVARVQRLPVPVVSIGNITAGGTGKTPLVIHLARRLLEAGARPLILSRGYGSDGSGTRIVSDGRQVLLGPAQGGDEPVLIAASVPGAPVVVDPDRVRGGIESVRRFRPGVILLDDGFQHRRLARDLDLVLLDATDPFGRYRMLPSGTLREPLTGLARADIFVVTRAPGGEPLRTLEAVLRRYNDRAPILRASHTPDALVPVEAPDDGPGAWLSPQALVGASVFAFCGIGNPEGFRATLQAAGARIAGFETYRDHHVFTTHEIERLAARAKASSAGLFVTTEKDAIRIERAPDGIPLLALRIRMEISDERLLLDPVLALAERP